MKTQMWAMTTWANRASANYVPITSAIDNVTIDAFGRKSGSIDYKSPIPRRFYKKEDGTSAAYVMYDDDSAGNVPVIKVTEA